MIFQSRVAIKFNKWYENAAQCLTIFATKIYLLLSDTNDLLTLQYSLALATGEPTCYM